MRQIVSFGGGGFSMESGNPLLDEFVLELTGKRAPEGLLPALGQRRRRPLHRPLLPPLLRLRAASPAHLSLFRRERAPADPREHLLSQDLIYVGGGSVTSLLGVWRAHGIDRDPARGLGARGRPLRALAPARCAGSPRGSRPSTAPPQRIEGLGLLPLEQHRPLLERARPPRRACSTWLRDGMPPAYAADDGAALHFVGDDVAPGGRLAAAAPAPTGSSSATATW